MHYEKYIEISRNSPFLPLPAQAEEEAVQEKRHSKKKQSCPMARAVHYLKCKKPMHFVIIRTCLEMGINQHHHLCFIN